MTISSDNPVNIDDVLENRSHNVGDKTYDSNHSTLTNQSIRSRSSVSTLTNQRTKKDSLSKYSDASTTSSKRGRRGPGIRAPVEILINDGEGSIDTLSNSSFNTAMSSPVNQLRSNSRNKVRPMLNQRSYSHRQMYDSDEDDDIDDDHAQSFEINSETEENSDLYVSPLDKVLDEEDSSSDFVS